MLFRLARVLFFVSRHKLAGRTLVEIDKYPVRMVISARSGPLQVYLKKIFSLLTT
jgi:hypothetical protein